MKHGYSSLQIALHWTVVVLIVTNYLLGGAMSQTFNALQRGAEVTSLGGAYAHVAIGLSLLIVMIARLTARLQRPVAVAPDSGHPLLSTLGRITHLSFYGILLLIPVLGAIAWFGGVGAAGNAHALAVWALIALIALHVSANLFHHFVLRDGLIRRMLRPTGGT